MNSVSQLFFIICGSCCMAKGTFGEKRTLAVTYLIAHHNLNTLYLLLVCQRDGASIGYLKENENLETNQMLFVLCWYHQCDLFSAYVHVWTSALCYLSLPAPHPLSQTHIWEHKSNFLKCMN